ncbi:MAG: hypothetical protein JF616_06100 [Fibrobacteres bacterium]|nr:hypothetical protein [Fibrobacterota bacterium]
MKMNRIALLIWAALAMGANAEDKPEVKLRPLQFGALQEFGMIRKGLLGSTPIQEMNNEWVDRFGSYFVQEAVVGNNLVLQGGLGGIFEFPKPEKSGEEFGGSQYKLFYIGPSVAKAMYHFGGVEQDWISLGGGMFPFKYNPDANDLGDYLFRSQPYPTSIMTGGNGGLTAIGDQTTVLQGFHGHAGLGKLTLDALLTTETGLPPLYDWSLAFLGDLQLGDGLLDIGAGVNFKRLIQIKPEKTRVEDLENSYFKKRGVWFSGDAAYYKNPASFLTSKASEAYAKNTPADSAIGNAYTARSHALSAIVDSLALGGPWVDSTGHVPGAQYYTPAGIMLMARASLDLKKLIPGGDFSPSDLRLYAEVAVLGVESYPVYYKKITERMPIMVGFNLPTFKWVDLFSVQFEYFNSPNLNNTYTMGQKNWAVPYLPEDNLFSGREWNDLTTKDNISWSILMRKRVLGGLTFNAQVARDHMRTIGTDWYYGSRFEPNEILHKSSSWYWMFQLAWDIKG